MPRQERLRTRSKLLPVSSSRDDSILAATDPATGPHKTVEGLASCDQAAPVYCCCCCCVVAGRGFGNTVQSGQPMTLSFFVRCSLSRRCAISAWNCSSVSDTRCPRSMNMFATDRFPDPCQFLGSGTFLLPGELFM